MGSPIIFAGNDAKLLKSNLDFGNTKVITGSFAAANNQSAATDVTGLSLANASYRGAKIIITIHIDATSDLMATYTLDCSQLSASWEMSQEYVGQVTGIVFTITSAGQLQYTSTNVTGYSSSVFKWTAIATDA